MTIGQKIKIARTQKGLSQERMSELMEMSPRNYGNIERGIHNVYFKQVEQIAKICGLSVVELVQIGEVKPDYLKELKEVVKELKQTLIL